MTSEEPFVVLARRLKSVHQRIEDLLVPEAEKSSVRRRLRIIADASKHDVERAATRLDLLVTELDRRERRH